MSDAGSEGGSILRRLVWRALRVRLFYKILVANGVVVGLAATAGVLLGPGLRLQPEHSLADVAVPLAVAAVALTLLVNGLILRFALEPIRRLERAAARVCGGDLTARVEPSPVADRDITRLTAAFNEALDSAARYRRRLRETAARSTRAEEEERRRVARALHDDVAQRLASLMIRLGAAESRGAGPEEAREVLGEARDELAGAVEVVRRYALGRRPPILDDLGLAAAVESYARATIGEGPPRLELEVEADGCDASPEKELAAYRILQEAIDNVAAHAEADGVVLRLRCGPAGIRAVVEDDGRGFSVHEAIEAGALGLFEMEERAAAVGGSLEIRSAPRGTRVELSLPADAGAAGDRGDGATGVPE